MDSYALTYWVQKFQKIAPKLSHMEITAPLAFELFEKIATGKVANSLTEPLKLEVQVSFPLEERLIFKLQPNPQQKAKVLRLNTDVFVTSFYYEIMNNFQSAFDLIDLSEGIDINEILSMISTQQGLLIQFFKIIMNKLDWTEIEILTDTAGLDLIQTLVRYNDRFWEFKRLLFLQIDLYEFTEVGLFKYCEFPLVRQLNIFQLGLE